MPIEAELKARVRDVRGVKERLREFAAEQVAVYRDTYYDRPGRELTSEGRELRVRVVERDTERRVLLTYKTPVVDDESGSKPEDETRVGSPEVLDTILRGLGFEHLVKLVKHCANYTFTVDGRECTATLVTVPELDGTFLEVETLVDDNELTDGLATVRRVLSDLGIGDDDLTTEQYTDA
ncbi:class IV adenylate cyclase [Allosalinactinospora lopnorensis]|uniref:class IV adenylate cyclase n=1 Tax=Allosalinactinospora lopnorensis TaxID=1352348 RepID=UPI000623DE1A|nr:class IV adenylate cyclase [Allosalinactinospora lopnorensis]